MSKRKVFFSFEATKKLFENKNASHRNHIAILQIYSESTDNLDIKKLMDDFISKTLKRTAVFAMSKNKS